MGILKAMSWQDVRNDSNSGLINAFIKVCNFVCHDRCLKTVVSYCSGVALQLIKVICEYYVHVDCQDLAVSDCKEAATYVPSLDKCLAGMRCGWCSATIMLPPNCLTIPRTELPMEQLLNIHASSHADASNQNLSSPSRVQPDDASSASADDPKEREDSEILRIYDGNNSLRNQDTALRRFHITDNPESYYVTQVLNDKKAIVKLYGGWLRCSFKIILLSLVRVPVTFCTLTVTKETLVQDAIAEALDRFGLERSTANRYNLIEVSLDRGVAERTANPQENMLQLVRNLRKDSLRRYHVVRFYVQEKEDPHDHAVFVGNLPVSLAQRQYERILLRLLGAKGLDFWKPFTAIGPIYFELYVFRNIPKYKILACGGDGTIGWVLQCLDIAKQDAACFSPPCGIVPVLRWGGGYTGEENPLDILKDVIEAEEPPTTSGVEPSPETEQMMSNPEDQTSMIIMNNYFGIGIDADVCLQFHNKRDANPEKFSSRLFNKTQYVCKRHFSSVHAKISGSALSLRMLLPTFDCSWGSGANPWGTAKEEGQFQKPTHYDGLLEVVGISDVSRLGLIQSKLSAGIRIAQGGSIRITTHEEWPVQVDGEPHIQPPGTITILKSALKHLNLFSSADTSAVMEKFNPLKLMAACSNEVVLTQLIMTVEKGW
uniref:diacylglycerol kinase (ATP) n=1 Tax=Parascaris equorum TaxID=6256 RepID=A0A914RSV8_PAREQ